MGRKINRRKFLKSAAAAGLVPAELLSQAGQSTGVVEIHLNAFYPIARWYFDPVGVWIQPGQTVRWSCHKWGGTVTAFHPDNDNHELRIPRGALPFDSGILIEGDSPRARFEWTFRQEGTYDYFSRRQERIGAVGRIVVGRPGGPGEEPFGYGEKEGRALVYEPARKIFEHVSSERIVREGSIPYPTDLIGRTFPVEESHF